MVGSYVRRAFVDHEVVLTDVYEGWSTVDVCDATAVKRAIAEARPDAVLHLAAATDVDRCEQEPDWAERTNAVGTQNVVRACETSSIPLVYVSTGAVLSVTVMVTLSVPALPNASVAVQMSVVVPTGKTAPGPIASG